MHETRPLLGIGLMLLAVLCFAALDATSKTLSQTFAVPLLVWARYAFHLLMMLLFLAPSMKWKLVATRRPRLHIVRALLLVGTTGFAMVAIRTMPLAEATAIVFVTPLAVAVLAGPMLGERVGRNRWIALLFGFCGMLLVARPGGAMSPAGIAWALAAAACYTLYQIQTRQLAATEDTWTMLFYTALVGTVAMSLGLPLFWSNELPTPTEALMIASLGIYGGTGHFMLIRAFRFAPASTLAPFVYSQLVYAALFGWMFYDHIPDAVSVAGMAVIAGSSILMAILERRAQVLRMP
ncbi:MAG: DMT family transporter [Rhodocyclales bacterium]|nr:DMT family transporter [Rhodocyclales bacterium]